MVAKLTFNAIAADDGVVVVVVCCPTEARTFLTVKQASGLLFCRRRQLVYSSHRQLPCSIILT